MSRSLDRHTPDAALVVGAGVMGAGIAQVLLEAGVEVTLTDVSEVALASARARIEQGLARRHAPAEVASHLDRFDVAPVPGGATYDLIVEAVPEDPNLKSTVLAELDNRFPDAPLLATNTSSLSITELSRRLADPSRLVGMHFFNPVPASSLVEIVVGDDSLPAAVTLATNWVQRLERTSIVVRDSPGFATSRLGVAAGLEAIRMVEEGVASAEDIDLGMTLGYRLPVGPLRLTDLVGLDVRLHIAQNLHRAYGDRFEPPALLVTMVRDGKLGKKSGQGFYRW